MGESDRCVHKPSLVYLNEFVRIEVMKIAELKQVDNMLLDWSDYYLLPIEQDCFWMDIRIFNRNRLKHDLLLNLFI